MQLFHPHFKLLRLECLKMVMNWEPEIICVKLLLECPFAKRPNAISATSVCYCSASANPWATYLLYQIHITHIGFYQLRQFFLQSLLYIFKTGLIFVATVQKKLRLRIFLQTWSLIQNVQGSELMMYSFNNMQIPCRLFLRMWTTISQKQPPRL